MKVCVTGSFGNHDVGDDAMLTCWLDELARIGVARRDTWLVGHEVEYMSRYFRHPADRCLPCKTFPGRFRVADATCLLVTGGGTLNTRDARGASLMRARRLVTPFAAARVPIFVSGQTVGPLGKRADHDRVARRIVEAADVFTTRDSTHSPATIRAIGARPRRLILTTDDAAELPFERAALPRFFEQMLALCGDVAAVNVTDYTSDSPAKLKFVAGVVKDIRRSGLGVVLVPHHPKDVEAHKRIARLVEADARVLALDEPCWTAERIKKVLSRCALAVGGRYHFVVFAVTTSTPCVGMNGNEYSYVKQHGFMHDAGVGGHALTPKQTFDRAAVAAKIAEVLRGPPAVRPLMRSKSFAAFRAWFSGLKGK